MPTINGKEVTFREKLRADMWWPLFPTLTAAMQAIGGAPDDESRGMILFRSVEWDFACQVISGMVESWEFDGDPADADVIGSLDLISEVLPLFSAVISTVIERLNLLGEAARGSSLASSSEGPSIGDTGASG